MEKKNAFIVSFGDSDKFRAEFDGTKDQFESSPEFVALVGKVAGYVKSHFPGDDYKRYITPQVMEVDADDVRFAGFPKFDDAVASEIEKTLSVEIENMRSQKELDSNAPYSDIN